MTPTNFTRDVSPDVNVGGAEQVGTRMGLVDGTVVMIMQPTNPIFSPEGTREWIKVREWRAGGAVRVAPEHIGRIAISSGHGGALRADGRFVDSGATGTDFSGNSRIEAVENRRVVREIVRLLSARRDIIVSEIHDDTSTENPAAGLIRLHNEIGERHLDVQIHFNSTAGARGTETIHNDNRPNVDLSGRKIAERVSNAITNASGLALRSIPPRHNGSIYLPDLNRPVGFLSDSRTLQNAIIPEICFINTPADMEIYDANFNRICQAIADELAATAIAIAASSR